MRKYVKPTIESEVFIANSFVSACGDTNIEGYTFECDATGGSLYTYKNGYWPFTSRYVVKEGEPFTFENASNYEKEHLGNLTPCDKQHTTSNKSEFLWGFVDYDNDGTHDSTETVIVLRESFIGFTSNAHATKSIGQLTSQINRS